MILTGWEKCARRNTLQILGLRKNCSLFGKSWFSFFMFRKKKGITSDTDSLKEFWNHSFSYKSLSDFIKGIIRTLLYRYNNTSLVFCMSSTTMKPKAHLIHHLLPCAQVCGTGARGRQTLRVWWRQDHNPSRINCRSCGDQVSRECAYHGLDKRAPNGILKNTDFFFFKLHEYLDEGEEALWFHASAGSTDWQFYLQTQL